MKKFYNNTLIGGAFSKALRVLALLCVLLGVSSSAWADADFQQTDTWNVKYYPGSGGDTWGKAYAVGEDANLGELSGTPYLKGVWVKTEGGTQITSIQVDYNGKKVATLSYGGNSGDWNRYWSTEDLNEALTNTPGTHSFTIKFSTNTGKYITRTITYSISGSTSSKYYAKYNWGGGNWSWKELDSNNQITATYHNNCMNVATSQDDNATCYSITLNGTIGNGTECIFTWDHATQTLTATPVGGGSGGDDTGDCTTVYLNDANTVWNHSGAELYVYYWKDSGSVWKKLKSATGCPKIFYASIPSDVNGYKYVRLNNVPGKPSWDRKWNETGDLSLTSQTEYKLSDGNGNGSLQNTNCDETDPDCGNTGDNDDDDDTSDCDYIEVWCKGSQSYVTMNCYAWDANENKLLGEWPGQQTSVTDIYTDGAKYAIWKFSSTDNINIIFNNGSGKQTANITGLRKGNRYVYTLNDDWSYNPTSEKLDCSLPATNILLAREASVDVVAKTATVYGYLKNNPNCDEITDYGFYFCTTADGAAACTPVANNELKWSASSTEILPRGKEFSANTGELFDGTTYYYRAYAVIGEETVLSQEVRSITTEPCKQQACCGDPIIYTVDATFKSDNTCKLQFRDVQKAIDHLKGSYANEEGYRYVTVDNGSYNLNQPVVINVCYYDDTPNDPTLAYTYRGTTHTGMTAGNVAPTHVNLIEDINKNATNKANTLTIKAGNNKAKPWVHHVVIRNSKNITLDSLCIYSDPTGLKDNALEIDVNSSSWPSITPSFTDANITISNCMIGSAGFTGLHVSGYDGITFKGNDIEASFTDRTNETNILNWGASAKFLACKNIKFIQNNFRGSQPTLLWIQDSENALFMNNVFWNTNTYTTTSGVTPSAIRLVNQYGKTIQNISFFYNTFYLEENGTTGNNSKYNFFIKYSAAANESTTGSQFFGSNIYFQYNNCYSYDKDCPGSDAFYATGSGDGTSVTYKVNSGTTDDANFCPNNFWSVKDAANATKSIFDFTTCDGSQIINVKNQVCKTTASGPASLIVRGSDMNLGSAPDVSFTGIQLEADEVLADRYLVGVRPNGEGWTYGAYQTREGKDVEKIFWVGITDNWDDRNNWEFEVKNNDKIVRQRVSCVENLSANLHVVIEEIGTVEVAGGRKWPKLPESFDHQYRYTTSLIPVAEQVNAGNTNKFADHIELEYGAGIIGVEKLKNGELHYTKASNKFVSPRSEWILVGPTIKPFDDETPTADDVRNVVSGDYFIKNHEPHVYMHQAKFLQDGNVGWDLTFADLKAPLTHDKVFAMQIPDEYGDYKLPAELHYAYISPNPSMMKDASVSKEFLFEGRFYNEDALPTYTGLTTGNSVLISNTYPANIDAYMLDNSGLGKVQIYDYEAKSFGPLKAKASTPILAQHGFVFTPATNDDLVITQEYFLHTITRRTAEVTQQYCRINVKNMKSNASSDIEVELDELKENVANYATDAPKVFNSMEKSLPDMYVMRYDKKWAGVTIPSMTESIPLGVRISEAGTTIRFSYVDSEGLGDVILEDRLTGETYNLTIGQLCEFSDLPIGDCEGRFFLNLSEKIEEDEDNTEEGGDVSTEVEEEFTDSGISIIGNSNGVVVSCSTDMELQYIYINDMSGKTAMYKVSGNYIEISLPVAQGVYTVNVIADKANKTGKVILK